MSYSGLGLILFQVIGVVITFSALFLRIISITFRKGGRDMGHFRKHLLFMEVTFEIYVCMFGFNFLRLCFHDE